MKTAFQLIEEHGLTLHGDIEHFAELVRADESARMAEQLAQQEPVAAAMRTVIEAMQVDPEYAWSWHCNIAMAFVDAGGDHYTGNQGAARFMKMLANVEPAHELPSSQVQRTWVDPNDKTQKQYLPHIGEPVLFCNNGVTYMGKHTGGSFQSEVTNQYFNTWECQWMYLPAAHGIKENT